MARYRTKPTMVSATQWFKHGDHPEVQCALTTGEAWLPAPEGRRIVKPGDWIVVSETGDRATYSMPDEAFKVRYEPMEWSDVFARSR